MVGPGVLYHCTCTSFPSTSSGVSGTTLIPPFPLHPSYPYAFHPLPNLYFCEECDKIRCNRCITVEVSGYHCPNCLFEVPSASVRAEKNRCARNCFQCPQCSNTLSVVSSDPQPTSDSRVLPAVSVVGEPPFFLYCNYCRWDSTEVGITFDKPTGLALQLQKTEDSSYDAIEFDRLKEHFEPVMRNSANSQPTTGAHSLHQGSSRTSALSAINAAASSALAREIPGLRKKRVDSNTSKDEYGGFYKSRADCVSGREEHIAEVDWLRNLTQEEFTLGEVASLEQRWINSWTQSLKSSALRPLRIPLHSKQTKRCPKCRHILIKPEQKSQSIRFKIKLMAANYVPSIDVMVKHPPPTTAPSAMSRTMAAKAKQVAGGDDPNAGQPLQPGKSYAFQLSLTNPLYEPVQARVTVQKPPSKQGNKRAPFTISLPSNPFPIGAFAEAWEYDDEGEDVEMNEDDIEDLLAGRESSPAPGRDDTKRETNKESSNVGFLERRANITKIGGEVIVGNESSNPLQFNLLISYTYRAEEQSSSVEVSTADAPSRSTGGETKTFSFYITVNLGPVATVS
ncbi:dynactin p62 family-domain-containing protein [Cantharellus anzutake]|uniref:dynactin p62 family-domain-containing protein n=1 Tax=Cantharellus anzutake TaxID=1750568 RepID=UPI001907F38B|nr:dynactin p62 family-domain-containing protein [Cantharellus anzutake]KAF8324319.1 dynactin p62 family-domain-containing protein [Cantharellus anzutake]